MKDMKFNYALAFAVVLQAVALIWYVSKLDSKVEKLYKFYEEESHKSVVENQVKMKLVLIIKDGSTMPSEAEVNAKIQELKDAEQVVIDKKASGKQKLKELGLDDAEIKALMGV